MRNFDLNIEKILENWEIYHAVRELLANAMDEQFLTKTKGIEVYKNGDKWTIRDYGRGLHYTSLTQNENKEKLSNPRVIGKFGIGLKDALATLDRQNVDVRIMSKYNKISTKQLEKEGFSEIRTLHAIIDENVDKDFVGTEITLSNLNDNDIELAKQLFLMFSDSEILTTTKYGDIISRKSKKAFIYINGVKVAEEENFLFSYNITNISSQIKKAINRERTNVGRTAYADTIKKILLSTRSEKVAELLALELKKINTGDISDELTWIDIQEHSVKILNGTGKYLFLSSEQVMFNNNLVDEARSSGKKLIIIPDNLLRKIQGGIDFNGNPIMDLGQFENEYNDSFEYDFVDENKLTISEKRIFSYTETIVGLFGGYPKKVKGLKISNTLRKDFYSDSDTLGCWDPEKAIIVIGRKQLRTLSNYSGTVIHELIHAKTNYEDVDRKFESELTKQIGKYLEMYILQKGNNF